jgi:hypothetical protein
MSPNPQGDRAEAILDEAMALLREWNIDPFDVLASEIGESGYLTFRRDSLGKLVFNLNDEPLLDVHEWPKGFPVKEFLALVQRGFGR